jgi:hypothetical protein
MIPRLIGRGDARLTKKVGKLELYAFRKEEQIQREVK